MPTRVLSIDPGVTTGVALVQIYDGKLLETHIITDVHELSRLVQRVGLEMSVFGVIEDFVGSGPRTNEAIFVLKLIGRLEAICESVDMPYVLRAPQARIPLVNEAKKRTERGTSPHIIAAYAHALALIEKGLYESVNSI